ncbi:hypothetical protein ACHAPQ_005043 [Fusarium lateritium]
MAWFLPMVWLAMHFFLIFENPWFTSFKPSTTTTTTSNNNNNNNNSKMVSFSGVMGIVGTVLEVSSHLVTVVEKSVNLAMSWFGGGREKPKSVEMAIIKVERVDLLEKEVATLQARVLALEQQARATRSSSRESKVRHRTGTGLANA